MALFPTCGGRAFFMKEKSMSIAGYVWFDAEFSSLDLEKAVLLQVAAVATDVHLKPLTDDLGPLEMVIQLDPGVKVSPWVKEHLSGLITRCSEVSAVSLEEADARLSEWLQTYFSSCAMPIHERPLLGGNSVHNDWLMVRRHLPKFHGGLNYRLLDVSSFKTVWEAWGEGSSFDKERLDELNHYFPGGGINALAPHDALFDIQASIAELAYYREKLGFDSI